MPHALSVTYQPSTVPGSYFLLVEIFLCSLLLSSFTSSNLIKIHLSCISYDLTDLLAWCYTVWPCCFFPLIFTCSTCMYHMCVPMCFSFGLFVESSSWYQHRCLPLLLSIVYFETWFLPEPGPSISDYTGGPSSWGKSAYTCPVNAGL